MTYIIVILKIPIHAAYNKGRWKNDLLANSGTDHRVQIVSAANDHLILFSIN